MGENAVLARHPHRIRPLAPVVLALVLLAGCGRSPRDSAPLAVEAPRLGANELYLLGIPVRSDTVRAAWDGRGILTINGVVVSEPASAARGPGGAVRSGALALREKSARAYEEALLAGEEGRGAAEAALGAWSASDRDLLDGEAVSGDGVIDLRLAGGTRETWVLSSEGSRVPMRFTREEAARIGRDLVRTLGAAEGPTLAVIGFRPHFFADPGEARAGLEQIRAARRGDAPLGGPLDERELALFGPDG